MSAPKPSVQLIKHHSPPETLHIGPITLHVLLDGTATSQRLSAVLIALPPHTSGPPAHWHEMHDETFLVTRGRARFLVPPTTSPSGEKQEGTTIEAAAGDYVVVPIRAPHTFENPYDEPCEIFNTFSPAFYIEYFRLLDRLTREKVGKGEGGRLDGDVVARAMARWATMPAEVQADEVMK
jgi:oxalate decarboxylase/phosphoglucose isomerase-like protein (cupin superfamily)